jgi:hypothetical protein
MVTHIMPKFQSSSCQMRLILRGEEFFDDMYDSKRKEFNLLFRHAENIEPVSRPSLVVLFLTVDLLIWW